MGKKRSKYDLELLRQTQAAEAEIDSIYREAVRRVTRLGYSREAPDGKLFSFDEAGAIVSKQFNAEQKRLMTSVASAIREDVRKSWKLANSKNDKMVQTVLNGRGLEITDRLKRRYFSTNDEALAAFIGRKSNGLGLSERVWKYAEQFKSEIEMAIDIGLRDGRSADALSRDVRAYLRNPDKLFRRVRDEHGQLVLSKAAKAYHPGRGVYRSSYKNARRLASTETNMAYHKADKERWSQLDFIVGFRVEPSKNHPEPDICDDLKGEYPKTFDFSGWHPHCRCHAVPIMKSDDEMMKDNAAILAGEEPSENSENTVRNVPAGFSEWVRLNGARIDAAKSLPYFIRDNRAVVDNILNPQLTPQPVRAAAEVAGDMVMRRAEEAFAAALGIERDKPMTFEEANEMRGNPHYKEDKKFQINCQSCVVANEMRRRGFNVEALAYKRRGASAELAEQPELAWLDADGKTPKPNRSGVTPEVHYYGTKEFTMWKKTWDTREQLVSMFEADAVEDGRYHLYWFWKGRRADGHIVTAERVNGKMRYYDPQTGAVLSNSADFAKYIDGIDSGINWLRVDNLRVNTDVAKGVLTPAGGKAVITQSKAVRGAGSRGLLGNVTADNADSEDAIRKVELRNRKKAVCDEAHFPTFQGSIEIPNLASGNLNLSGNSRKNLLKHCYNSEQIDASQYIWNNPEKLRFVANSPLGDVKDKSDPVAVENVKKKRQRGVTGYNEYEFEYNGKTWHIKLEATKRGEEQFYSFTTNK